MKLTVSMITMNEEGAVAKVVKDIRGVAPDAEILLVDSSKDRTAAIAEQLGCRVIKQFPPQGYGPAMDRAVREASGEIVVTLDCDDTYPVEVIPELVKMIDEGYDLVNLQRARALLAGESLAPLPPEAFQLKRRQAASAPPDTDVDEGSRRVSAKRKGRA